MTDRELIESLGGAAQVAERLGYDKDGGTQRVHNWTVRGIPAAVKVRHPDLFMPELLTPEHPAPAHEVSDAA